MKNLMYGALLLVLGSGCASVRDEIDESMTSIKSRTAASAAWSDSTAIFKGIDDEQHFADGFRLARTYDLSP